MRRTDAAITTAIGLALASGPVEEVRALGALIVVGALAAAAARHDRRRESRVDHVGHQQPAAAPARRCGDLVGAGDRGGRP